VLELGDNQERSTVTTIITTTAKSAPIRSRDQVCHQADFHAARMFATEVR
jgi:hypothetical protein